MNGYTLLLAGIAGRLLGAAAISGLIWLGYVWATAPIVVAS
ncbi:MAG: hypothetical protein AAF737_01355 [Pseudomonadota bacterium]